MRPGHGGSGTGVLRGAPPPGAAAPRHRADQGWAHRARPASFSWLGAIRKVTGEPTPLAKALARLLRPLIRILLRHGIPYRTFSDIARSVYVQVADEEFALPGRKQTTARIATLTGLSRKEVSQRRDQPLPDDEQARAHYNRAARVIAGWVRDPEFHNGPEQPAALDVEGERGFGALVERYAGDIPPRAILDELERVGAVQRDDRGAVHLLQRAYVPVRDATQKLYLLGTDVGDLVATIDHNLQDTGDCPRFQRKVVYDNIPEEFVPAFRQLASERAQTLIEELDRWLAQRDRDRSPAVGGTGRVRLGLAAHLIEDHSPETDSAPDHRGDTQ